MINDNDSSLYWHLPTVYFKGNWFEIPLSRRHFGDWVPKTSNSSPLKDNAQLRTHWHYTFCKFWSSQAMACCKREKVPWTKKKKNCKIRPCHDYTYCISLKMHILLYFFFAPVCSEEQARSWSEQASKPEDLSSIFLVALIQMWYRPCWPISLTYDVIALNCYMVCVRSQVGILTRDFDIDCSRILKNNLTAIQIAWHQVAFCLQYEPDLLAVLHLDNDCIWFFSVPIS